MNELQQTNTTGPSAFPPTMWTQVIKVRDDNATEDEQLLILNKLCKTYWQPLFQFARRLGNAPDYAQDLTQGFFVHLLQKNVFAMAEREKGKLRTLLLTAFNNYIRGEHQKSVAQKRGGMEGILSLDELEGAETSYLLETDEKASPEAIYDKRWALELLSAAADSLAQRYAESGKPDHYRSLRQFIAVSGNENSYSIEAEKLGIRVDYYRVLVQRFRTEFRKALTQQVKETLCPTAPEAEVQQEIMEIIRIAYG